MRNQRVVSFRIDDDNYQKIVALSDEKSVSVSSLLRQACLDGLNGKHYTRDGILVEMLLILRRTTETDNDEFWESIKDNKLKHLNRMYKND